MLLTIVKFMELPKPRKRVIGEVVHMAFEMTGRLRAHMDSSATELGLTPMQARALFMTTQPVSMSQLAGALHCDASNITGIVDRLEEQGYMERVVDPSDRRRRNLVVTPAGTAVATQLRDLLRQGNPILRLDDDDLDAMHAILLRVLQAAAGPDWTPGDAPGSP